MTIIRLINYLLSLDWRILVFFALVFLYVRYLWNLRKTRRQAQITATVNLKVQERAKKKAEQPHEISYKTFCQKALADVPIIFIRGAGGTGKSLVTMLIGIFRHIGYVISVKRNKRKYKYLGVSTYEDVIAAAKNGIMLDVYCNKDIKDTDGLAQAGNSKDILEMLKRAPKGATIIGDDFAEIYPQVLIYLYYKLSPVERKKLDNLNNVVRYARQIGLKIIINSQRDDVYCRLLDKGYKEIICVHSHNFVSVFGKLIRGAYNFIINVLPGIFSVNLFDVLSAELFGRARLFRTLKVIFLPAWWSAPYSYYTTRDIVKGDITIKHMHFLQVVELNGVRYSFYFTPRNIFNYETCGWRAEYERLVKSEVKYNV